MGMRMSNQTFLTKPKWYSETRKPAVPGDAISTIYILGLTQYAMLAVGIMNLVVIVRSMPGRSAGSPAAWALNHCMLLAAIPFLWITYAYSAAQVNRGLLSWTFARIVGAILVVAIAIGCILPVL